MIDGELEVIWLGCGAFIKTAGHGLHGLQHAIPNNYCHNISGNNKTKDGGL